MTHHQVVMDVAARALEIRSPTSKDLVLYLHTKILPDHVLLL
jgi:hypothetical protein